MSKVACTLLSSSRDAFLRFISIGLLALALGGPLIAQLALHLVIA